MCGQVLEWTQTMLEAGEAFCGSQSATLRDALKRQSGRFFAAYHSANLQVHSPGQHCGPCSSCFLVIRHKANYLYGPLTWYMLPLFYAPSLRHVADRGAATAAGRNAARSLEARFRGIAPFSDLDYR